MLRQSKDREKMCNCMVFDVTAIFFWITAFLKKLPFLAKGLVRATRVFVLIEFGGECADIYGMPESERDTREDSEHQRGCPTDSHEDRG